MTVSDIFKMAVHGDRIVRIYGNCEVPPEINQEWYYDKAIEYCTNYRNEPVELLRDTENMVIARRLAS